MDSLWSCLPLCSCEPSEMSCGSAVNMKLDPRFLSEAGEGAQRLGSIGQQPAERLGFFFSSLTFAARNLASGSAREAAPDVLFYVGKR